MSKIEDVNFRRYKEEQIVKMEKYVFTHACRRKYILAHFGEDYQNKCNHCDNCMNVHSYSTKDLTNETKLIIELINSLFNNFGCTLLVQILRGSKAKKIKSFFKLKLYNKG